MPGVCRQDARRKELVNGKQCAESAVYPEANAAGFECDLANESAVARLCGVTEGLDYLAAPRECTRYGPMDCPESAGILCEPAIDAVVPDERVQTHIRSRAAARLEQSV